MENSLQTTNQQVAQAQPENEAIKEFRIRCQVFTQKLQAFPPPESIDQTPDGNALTVLISHIEMTLDEMFFGLWETTDFKWSVIGNEVVGALQLTVVHPVTGQKMTRTGAAGIIITVNKRPDDIKDDPTASSRWANDPNNKKANALDLGFPKLKAECLKNAAQSFGKLFGRDLNRKKFDQFKGLLKTGAENPDNRSADILGAVDNAIKSKNNIIQPKKV